MADIAVLYDNKTMSFSWAITSPGLTEDNGLVTAQLISLFSDRQAPADTVPDGDERRGWWADAYLDDENDAWGSLLWLLAREKQMTIVLRKAEKYAVEALRWMIEDRVVQQIIPSAEIVSDGILGLTIATSRGNNILQKKRFEIFWKEN